MAVQKSRKSRSRRGMKRAQSYQLKSLPTLSTDPETGEIHLRHHVTPDGFYRGKRVLPEKLVAKDDQHDHDHDHHEDH